MSITETEYGAGGFDPAKPNNNVLSTRTITLDPATANAGTLEAKAQTALTNNATFLGLASPTNAQAVAQVQALTRQVNALIRLALGLLDSTADT